MRYRSVCRGGRPRAALRVPVVDPLEQRALLAAVLLPDGTLQVTGTGVADEVTLRRGEEPGKLNVEEGRTTLYVFLSAGVRRIEIDLGAGDDVVNIDTARGLLTGAGDATVHVAGGDGNDALFVFGAAPGGAAAQVFTAGPEVGGGTLVTRVGTETQTVQFAALESLADTSTAATFTLAGNDGSNVVELSAGPLAGGVTQTAMARFYDVSPCPLLTPPATPTPVPPGTTPAPAATAPAPEAPSITGPTPPAAAVDARDPEARREAKRQAKAAKREAKRLAREAKRLAREQKKAASRAARSALVTPAPAAPVGGAWVIDRAHLAVQFANKAAVVVDTKAGDDRVDVNLATAPAGLASLSVDGAAGIDRLCARALPAGVAVQQPGVEASSAARDFELMTECPAPYVPAVPNEPPPPLPTDNGGGAGSSAATASRDRDATASGNASSSRDSDDSDDDTNGSKDRDKSSSKDSDSNSSNDHNASNDD